jgi:hypothetical protein
VYTNETYIFHEGILNIDLHVYNKVSTLNIHTTMTIGYPILNPSLSITSSIFDDTVIYPTSILWRVSMVRGSNVNVQVIYGDESNENVPTENMYFLGKWPGDLILNHTHIYPGNNYLK